MFGTNALMKCVAKAALNYVGLGFGGELIVEVIPEIARDVWQWWGKDRPLEQLRQELQDVAQLSAVEAASHAGQAVAEEAEAKSATERAALTAYLSLIPSAIRQSQRRASDPTGRTMSLSLSLVKPADVLSLLPTRLPRFKPGDRPLPGMNLELVELLGAGGFGEVWKAQNPRFDGLPPVALKFCLDPAAKDRLLHHEAAVLNQVMKTGSHPGIVPLLDTFLDAEPPFLKYEFVAGGDLGGLIRETRLKGGLPPRQAARIVQEIAEAVGFAHRLKPPIVHRDLKPANILVQRKADGKWAFRVADFGIGGIAASQAIGQTRMGTPQGLLLTSSLRGSYTPIYASPQQEQGEPPDPRDDVYSLGVIWYQLLTGEISMRALSGSAWKKRLAEKGMPQPLVDLLEKCIDSLPTDRPDNAAILAESIAAIIDNPPTSPFEQEIKDALEEWRTAPWLLSCSVQEWGGSQAYFKRQGRSRIADWQTAAEKGDRFAQWLLARCLQEGTGVKQDHQAAVSWLRRAAESGLAVAQNTLGSCYYSGEGTDEDVREAFRLYTKAAEQGLANAQFNMGWCYEYGAGVAHNWSEAVKWYGKAAEQDIDEAQFNLGYCYQHGYGVDRDLAQAETWYRKAAGQGHRGAKNALAQLGFPSDPDAGNKPNDKADIPEQFRVTKKRLMVLRAIEALGGKRIECGQVHKFTAEKYGWNSNTTGNATYNCCVNDYTLEWGTLLDDKEGFFTVTPKGWRVLTANPAVELVPPPVGPSPDPKQVDRTSYWVVAPYSANSPEEWKRVWAFDLANNTISIGWEELGDISALNEEELRAAIDRTFFNTSPIGRGQFFGMLWNFFHEIKLGDAVIARQGLKKLAAVGTVTRTAYYDPNKDLSAVGDWFTFAYHLDVQWDEYPRHKEFDEQVFGMLTVYQITEEKFSTLIGKDKPIRERWLKSMRLLLEKGATSPDTAIKFSTFRVEAKAAGGIMYGYDGFSSAGLIEWLKREDESGWFLYLTNAGRAALEANSV